MPRKVHLTVEGQLASRAFETRGASVRCTARGISTTMEWDAVKNTPQGNTLHCDAVKGTSTREYTSLQ